MPQMTKLCRILRVASLRGAWFSLLLLAGNAFATLGQDVSSVESDRLRMNAEARVTPGQQYSIHEIRAGNGTKIREYVSPAGTVFAVAWQGPTVPDLRQLLGDHFDEYMRAAQMPPRVHTRAVHLETDDLIFESGGHMRFIVGRAYLRSKLPPGVRDDQIQ